MEFTIDNVKLYFKKNGHDNNNNDNNNNDNDNDNNLKKENLQYYYVDIEQLIKNIRMDFATKKVELYCSYFTTCQECKIKYNL